jgi:hypothetical protein
LGWKDHGGFGRSLGLNANHGGTMLTHDRSKCLDRDFRFPHGGVGWKAKFKGRHGSLSWREVYSRIEASASSRSNRSACSARCREAAESVQRTIARRTMRTPGGGVFVDHYDTAAREKAYSRRT